MKIAYKVDFDKYNWIRYISHLDLMRLFSRALRRAGFRLYLTKGFNPHPVIRIDHALKLGLEGRGLKASFILEENLAPHDFTERLNNQLPEGLRITNAEVLI